MRHRPQNQEGVGCASSIVVASSSCRGMANDPALPGLPPSGTKPFAYRKRLGPSSPSVRRNRFVCSQINKTVAMSTRYRTSGHQRLSLAGVHAASSPHLLSG